MQHTFETPTPTSVFVELGSGRVDVTATTTDQTTVTVDGKYAEDTLVEQRGDQIVVLAPRRTGFFGSSELLVGITLPEGSAIATKLGSADFVANGRLGGVRLKSGSGDVSLDGLDGESLIETGSGDLSVHTVRGDLHGRTGSGDIMLQRVEAPVRVSTGSGDVQATTVAADLEVKSGSGDLLVRDAADDVALTTASGDLEVTRMVRGQLHAKNVSGDIRVGIPAGTPVWTDVAAVTGRVSSSLQGAGQPAEGQDYVEVRAKTVSGDIHLEQL